jgi:signal transduction histidine kinase
MRRTRLILAFTGLAPLAILAAMVTAGQLRQQSDQAIDQAMATARAVNARIDGELMADDSALQVLAGAAAIERKDWAGARLRSQRVMRDRPAWRDVVLYDRTTGRTIFSVRDGVSPPGNGGPPTERRDLQVRARFGNVVRAGSGCPCIAITLPAPPGDPAPYIIEAKIGLDVFQRILLDEIARSGLSSQSVSAVVDRQGNFIARTLDFRHRAANPGSTTLRAAIASRTSGIYEGVTLEGLRNRSAFATSKVNGFSTHIAMPDRQFRLLGAGSLGLTLTAVALALLVALVAMRFAYLEQLRWRGEQQRLVQSQKMEALGRFASGVAHDFNNMLHVVLSSLALIERDSSDGAVLRRTAMARQAAEKGAQLTSDLLQFARAEPIPLERVELAPLFAAIEGLVRRVLGDGITLEISVSDPSLAVRTNRAALEMALLNLAGNARDAMPEGGTLRFTARSADKSGCVVIEVADTGSGMSDEVAARALDPFFTTKDVGKGTGLGLAQVHSLMLQSQGSIAIVSSPGAGTTFKLEFPAA